MIQRSFSQEDQIAFAKLSGDYNPVHLDALKARRTCFGQLVIHGIHLLLWALDNLVSEKSDSLKLISLKVSFNRFIVPHYTDEMQLSTPTFTFHFIFMFTLVF